MADGGSQPPLSDMAKQHVREVRELVDAVCPILSKHKLDHWDGMVAMSCAMAFLMCQAQLSAKKSEKLLGIIRDTHKAMTEVLLLD